MHDSVYSCNNRLWNSAIKYFDLIDSRDGKTYKTIVIGSQIWMAENLNYSDSISYLGLKGRSWCYENSANSCAKYGRLYTWGTAMDSAGLWSTNGKGCGNDMECSPTNPVRGVFRDGWHLPTKAEFETLISSIGDEGGVGGKLRSKNGWNHSSRYQNTDDYSFTALPAGSRLSSGDYNNEGDNAFFWSSTEISGDMAYYITLYYNSDHVKPAYLFKSSGYSVRCVKD
jgi:uncharacterized protein (TIGR02145 family)